MHATFDLGPGRAMDDQEFYAFCARNPDLRIEREPGGQIIIMPPAGGETGYRNSNIAFQLTRWALANNKGAAFDSNTEFLLPDGSALAPDAAWVSKEQLARLTREQRKLFLPLCPEFVIELISPSDRLTRVMEKMARWIANGAVLGWLIDADREVVWIYRAARDSEELRGCEYLDGEGPVACLHLELADIWRGLS